MNLRTDEFGQMEDTLKELYKSLLEKEKIANVEYQNSHQKTQQLKSIREERSKEVKKVAAAYKEITGKELA